MHVAGELADDPQQRTLVVNRQPREQRRGAGDVGGAFTLIAATIGLSVKDSETAQSAGFIWVFPLTFASSAFVPVSSMPSWLQASADRNPITIMVNAMRSLVLGGPVSDLVWQALAWVAAILVVFGPIAVRTYRRVT